MKNTKRLCNDCKHCGLLLNLPEKVYCDFTCQQNYFYTVRVQKWLNQEIEGGTKGGLTNWAKRYLIETRGEKCEECGWCEKHPITEKVPLEFHHQGSHEDHRPENIKILCPNDHALTSSYKGLNRGKGRTAV